MRLKLDKNFEFSSAINRLIPAGAHTYSKADDQFPLNAPKGIKFGKGVYVTDIDDNEFLDWTMGLGSVSLGHGFKPIVDEVIKELANGSNFQRPSVIELEFAELLKEVMPQFDMFKYAKNGSTVTTAAVKLARAYTNRDLIAVCAEQPFFSYDDWFIGSTDCPSGVPEPISNMTLKFHYNDFESIDALFENNKGKIAGLIMELVKLDPPKPGFLEHVQKRCKENGTVFIVDEMITGFRFGINGAQEHFGVYGDLATYGKGIANGFSVAVLAGKREIMELGGIIPGKERVFLSSTTHGSETHGIRAAIATIKFMRENKTTEHNWANGEKLTQLLKESLEAFKLTEYIEVIGYPCAVGLSYKNHEKEHDPAFRTLFLQEMIANGLLFQGLFTQAYEHNDEEIKKTIVAFEKSLEVYKKAIDQKSVDGLLVGPVIKPVFRKIN